VTSARLSGPAIVATGQPGSWQCRWTGVLTCGHIWTCPVCSVRIRNERCARVLRAFQAAGGRWQMISITIAHHRGERLARLLNGLAAAWRRTRQGGLIQRLWKRHVSASVRAYEQTWSPENGWHPHAHIVLRTDEWTVRPYEWKRRGGKPCGLGVIDERQELVDRFRQCVRRELGDDNVPDLDRAIVWSEPLAIGEGEELSAQQHRLTRYMFKLGLEVTSPNKSARKRRSKTPWQLAEDGARGNVLARDLWLEYCRATRGHRMIELDDRAQQWAKKPRELIDYSEPLRKTDPKERVVIPIDALELRRLREYESFDPAILAKILSDASASICPKTVVRTWLELAIPGLRYTPADGSSGETQAQATSEKTYTSYFFDAPAREAPD
jgi:hypothetical protein